MFVGSSVLKALGNEGEKAQSSCENYKKTNRKEIPMACVENHKQCKIRESAEKENIASDDVVEKLQIQIKQQQQFIENFMQQHENQIADLKSTIARLETRICSCEAREKMMQIDLGRSIQKQNADCVNSQSKQSQQNAMSTPLSNPFRRGKTDRQAFPDFDEMFKDPVIGRTPPPKNRDENTDVQTPAAFDLTVQLMSEFGPQDDILHDGRGRILTMTQEQKDRAVSHTSGDSDKIFRFVFLNTWKF